MSFTQYVTENIIKPANLTNTYYWIGGQGMEPRGIRKNVVSIPGYVTTFRGSKGGRSWLHPWHMTHSGITLAKPVYPCVDQRLGSLISIAPIPRLFDNPPVM